MCFLWTVIFEEILQESPARAEQESAAGDHQVVSAGRDVYILLLQCEFNKFLST